ncbi:MAG: hypothetical protein JWM20_114 [Patescibacteria group bacterium]|nr:hypothetical protein [Patescibacteria group bacterium]
MEHIYCIMLKGANFNNDEILWILFSTCQKAFKEGKEKCNFKNEWCEGTLTTSWQIKGMGGTYGYFFSATIEWENKKTVVTFISRKTDLERKDLRWVSLQELLFPEELN